MTWTYTGDPNVSDRDKIRFLIGDTDTNDQLVNDEEIEWALTEAGSIYQAAHDLCTQLELRRGAPNASAARHSCVWWCALCWRAVCAHDCPCGVCVLVMGVVAPQLSSSVRKL